MKALIALSSATAFCFAAAVTTTAAADDNTSTQTEESVVVVSTNDRGQATQVRINGEIIDVCMSDAQDDCINPHAAGLDFGNTPLGYWPGKPASEK